MLASICGAALCTNAANIFSGIEHGKFARTFQSVCQFHELHSETHIGFVAAKTAHGINPRQSQERFTAKIVIANVLEQIFSHFLKHGYNIVLLHKAHFAVNLRELGLAVGS